MLGGVVAIAAGSMLAFLGTAEVAMSKRSEDAFEMTRTQQTIRTALQGLIAAPPMRPNEPARPNREDGSGDGDELPANNNAVLTEEEAFERAQQLLGGGVGAGLDPNLPILQAVADESVPPYFDLSLEEVEAPPGLGISSVILPRLELVVSQSPVPLPTDGLSNAELTTGQLAERYAGRIRGVFEVVAVDRAWSLFWTPIDPPGPPYELIGNLEGLSWTAIPNNVEEDYQEVASAYLQQDFPRGVLLRIRTKGGVEQEWAFECIVMTEGL